jgi:hypothetical protein
MVIPLSGRVPGRAPEPSRSRVCDSGGYGTFRGWRIGYSWFSRYVVFIGKRAESEGGQGAHTTPRRRLVVGCAGPSVVALGPHSGSSSVLLVYSGIIGTSVFMASNSENISYVTFLKYKNSKKQKLALWHLLNRLVPEKP